MRQANRQLWQTICPRLVMCRCSTLLLFGAVVAAGCNRDSENRPTIPDQSRPPLGSSATTNSGEQEGSDELTSVALTAVEKRPTDKPLFESLSAEESGVNFQMTLPKVEEYVREVIHLNVNGGICTGDYDGDGLTDFYVTSTSGGNRLFRNLGSFRFKDVTAEVGLTDTDFWGTGATFVDIDNDGDLDIYACGYRCPNRLFVNEGHEPGQPVQFEERAASYGLDFSGASMTMAFADIDNDGDLDGYLATTALSPPPGTKFKVRFEGDRPIVLDSLQEYWQLVYLPGERAFRTESGQFDHLFRNDGEKFTEISREAGIDGPYFTLSATWWDYNEDGFPDLYAANDFLGPDLLYHNNGNGTFTDVAKDVLPHVPWFSMGTDLADVNNDGRIDFLATDMAARTHGRQMVMRGNLSKSNWFLKIGVPRQYVRSALYINTGVGRMLEAGYQTKTAATDWTWSPRLADLDNDGRVDLYVTNGVVRDTMNSDLSEYADTHFTPASDKWVKFWANKAMHKESNVALRNLGDLKFEDVGADWGLDRNGVSFGSATADFDNDGDLDLVVNNADAPVSVYRNLSDNGHRVRIHLRGQTSNRFGINAKIELVAGGLRQANYMTLARGWLSGCEPVATFGLGNATTIEELTVEWPSGHRQKFNNLSVDQIYTIAEPSGPPSAQRRAQRPSSRQQQHATATMFVAANESPKIEYRENSFDDFALQPLLPNKLSEAGPAMAWADIDGDGDSDLYVGGSNREPGRLYVNMENVSFRPRVVVDEAPDEKGEDVDAIFFDADGDGDQDLYVVTGSVESPLNDAAYRDRLYLNDGHGKFQPADGDWLPDLRDSGSVAAACDFDRDGDIDLFVGSRSIPGQYPLPPTSRLLVNTGRRFEDQTPDALQQAGMVTGAVWSDIDGDGWDDLAITTDWGPIRVFANENGSLRERTEAAGLADRLGWWLAIAAGDVDHDGDADLVVTNLGLNSKYEATPERPELLYYGDFEGTGAKRILEARFQGSSLFPRRDLAALRNAMPTMMMPFGSYEEFSRATLADIFTQERLDEAEKLEVNTLESGVLLNEGNFHFRFEPLPRLAQIAPSHGLEVGDVNGDGNSDIVMAQNFYGPQPETGQLDGGVGLLLLGNGRGQFSPQDPAHSGIVVPEDARKVSIVELDGDGRPDLVFAVQNGRWRMFLNRSRSATESPRQETADGALTTGG